MRILTAVAGTVVTLMLGACTSAGTSASSASPSPTLQSSDQIAPALDAITSADIRRDLFAMSGDAMRGREAGTLDEMRATGWVAEQAREAGLKPAGDAAVCAGLISQRRFSSSPAWMSSKCTPS